MTGEKKRPGKKPAQGEKKESSKKRMTPKAVFNFTDIEAREVSLQKSTVEVLSNEAKKASKKGREISTDNILANIVFNHAEALKFKTVKVEKTKTKITLTHGLWELLEQAAKRNNSTLEEAIERLVCGK